VLADDMAADDYLRKNYSIALQHHAKSAQSSTIDPDTQKGGLADRRRTHLGEFQMSIERDV
jgi:hypothetical protein